MDAKLALVEFLLASTDLLASARHGIDWLATHAGVRQAVVAVIDPASPNLLLVAQHAVPAGAIAEFVIGRHGVSHPIIRAIGRVDPTSFAPSAGVQSPLVQDGFHAVPLRS